MVLDALISDLILYALDGGGRSWNLLFRREFNDWETGNFSLSLGMFLPKFQGG